MKILTNYWAEDVNKTDIIEWVKEALESLTTDEFGTTRIELIIFSRKWGVGKNGNDN